MNEASEIRTPAIVIPWSGGFVATHEDVCGWTSEVIPRQQQSRAQSIADAHTLFCDHGR